MSQNTCLHNMPTSNIKKVKAKVFHVVKSIQGWKIEEEGKMFSLFRSPLKREAVAKALELVKFEKESRLIIYNEDGSIAEEKSFSCRPTNS
jgi:hypothetical protein